MCTKPDGKVDELIYQIYINDKEKGYTLKRMGDLPKGTKSVGFADMGLYSFFFFTSPLSPFLPELNLSFFFSFFF